MPATTTAPALAPNAGSGVLDTLESVFWSLCRGPSHLNLPGHLFSPHRRRPVGLAEARELLLWPGRMQPSARDTVWAELVRRAQTNEPAWIVGAAGVLVPGLRRVLDRLSAGYDGDRDDLESEAVTGFLSALHTIDPDSGRIPSRLCWAAYRSGLALRHRDTDAVRRRANDVEAGAPPRPWGHPDFILAAAVREGVITTAEATLIGETRLEGIPLEQIATRLCVRRDTLITRRNRAERRLATALRSGDFGSAGISRRTRQQT